MNIELPKDADGREIPLDTKVLYDEDGNEYEVYYYKHSVRQTIPQHEWQVVMTDYIVHDCSDIYIAPPDSWKKLDEDLHAVVVCGDSPDLEDPVCAYRAISVRSAPNASSTQGIVLSICAKTSRLASIS